MTGRRAEHRFDLPAPFYDLQAVAQLAETFPDVRAEAAPIPSGIQLRLDVPADDQQLVGAYLNALLAARATRGISQ